MKINAIDHEGLHYEIEAENFDDGDIWHEGGASGISFTAYAGFDVATALRIARAILPSRYEIVTVGSDDNDQDAWLLYTGDGDAWEAWEAVDPRKRRQIGG